MTASSIAGPVLAGKVALVTGAAGGIGRAVVTRFAASGAQLALTDVRADALGELAASLSPADPLTVVADLTQEDAVRALVQATFDRFGRIDILVQTAGMLKATPLEEITKPEWDRVMEVNVAAPFLCARACIPVMKAQGAGRIINFSSIAGQVGGIFSGAHYAASKAAVISLTRSLAKYLAPHHICVNAIAPSGVETEMLAQFPDEILNSLRAGIPLQRFGTPGEIAELVLFLSSPAADYITGQTIGINGGSYLG